MILPFAYISQSGFQWLDVLAAFAAVVLYWCFWLSIGWFYSPFLIPIWWQLLHAAYRLRTYGKENVPATGPALIVCNHVSRIDWMLLWLTCPVA